MAALTASSVERGFARELAVSTADEWRRREA